MKTLKKTLCMVLAVVMVVGVLILPASADDAADKVKAQEAAYKTLKDYGIMHGRDGGAAALDEYVRRDEVATIVYRILTGDTSEDGKMAGNYKAAAKNFTDVATTNWAAGFIGYTAESKIFSGREGNKFDPTANVRGDELVKVMLRCLGYGAEDEYTGEGWNTRALYTAQEIGMLKGIDEEMDKPITRGAVSQIVKNAIELPMAVYYNGTYSIYRDASGRPVAPNTPGAKANPELVAYDEGRSAMKFDKWGAPYYDCAPTVTFNHVYNAKPIELDEYTEKVEPMGEYWVPTTECDVSEDGGIEKSAILDVYLNGAAQTDIAVQATDTVNTIGAQGQWIRTFDTIDNDDKDVIDRVVYVDTLLAVVTKVIKEEKDPAGHIKTEAAMELHVYADNTPVTTAVAADSANTNYVVKGNDYKKGDYILLYAVATGTAGAQTLKVDANSKGAGYELRGVAPQFTGKQTTIWYNQASHIIDKVTYLDNNRYTLDVAGNNGKTYVWFTDEHNNVIGSINPASAPANYAILTSMIWVNGNPGHAEATLLYMDGKTETVIVDEIDGHVSDATANFGGTFDANDVALKAADGTAASVTVAATGVSVSDEGSNNTMFQGYALYAVSINSDGSVDLDSTSYVVNGTAKVNNKGTEIDSTSGSKVYVDDATVFFVRSTSRTKGAYTYERYVGKDNVPTLQAATNKETGATANLTLFYADLNGDKVAEYVYVNQGSEKAADLSNLVAAMSNKYSRGLIDTDPYWALDSAFVGDGIAPSGTIFAKGAGTGILTLAGHVGEMYYVTYDPAGGDVTKVTAIDTDGLQVSNGNAASGNATKNVYKLSSVTYKANGTLIANYASITGKSWNLNLTSVKVYGKTKDQIKDIDFTKVNTYAVLSATSEALEALYIFDKPEGAPATPVPTPGTLDYTVNVSGTKITVNYHDGVVDDDNVDGFITAILAKLKSMGYTEVNVSSSDGTNYSFTSKKTTAGSTVTMVYTWDFTSGTGALPSILVNLNGTDTLLTTSTHGTIATLIDNAGAGVYVKAKSKSESKLTLKSADTTLAEGDTVVTTKKYVQVSDSVTAEAGTVTMATDTTQSGATLSYAAAFVDDPENTIWVTSGSNKYLELGKDYSLKVTITSDTDDTKIATGRKLVVKVEDNASKINAVENLTWGVADDLIAATAAHGTAKTVTFKLDSETLSGVTTGAITIKVTVAGAAA